MAKGEYIRLFQNTSEQCCYAGYPGYTTGAAFACSKMAVFSLLDGNGQPWLPYCEKHFAEEWGAHVEAGKLVEVGSEKDG